MASAPFEGEDGEEGCLLAPLEREVRVDVVVLMVGNAMLEELEVWFSVDGEMLREDDG
jgi:hypothetical protein